MITFEKAFQTAMALVPIMDCENVSLHDALGRTLSRDVVSDMDMPPFDKSAMDGFACRRADLDEALHVLETIPAGSVPQGTVSRLTCSRIMTGAMIPDGADCVIKFEDTETLDDGTIRFTAGRTENNICPCGEDIHRGETLLKSGELIKPEQIAVLAAAGCSRPEVFIRPRAGIIATGDELVEPERVPDRAQIRDSNSFMLDAQVRMAGAVATNYGVVTDEKAGLQAAVQKAMQENDLILLSGGVSAGDFDLVPDVLKSSGFELLFDQVAIKPGKPMTFGRAGQKFCFGLPGNPVSVFLMFNLLVKPFIFKMMGRVERLLSFPLPLGEGISRNKDDREAWIPVKIRDDLIFPVDYHGSAHINMACRIDGFVSIPIGVKSMAKGDIAYVRQV
ncbi:MAG: molybdopterin molybdotransferase MoeA [Candidatus Wallbacteria bacterium]|nr:molybdopterin molybdotransferase MoeA [Candidatus Wallbacteria bacterium]